MSGLSDPVSLEEKLRQRGISRRSFLQYCGALAAWLGLPQSAGPTIAQALERGPKPSVIWLSFQECTGCTESLTRAFSPSIEELILGLVSLDYHETLMAPSGAAAEVSLKQAMKDNSGRYLLAVDGSVSTKDGGVYSMGAGASHLSRLQEAIPGAAACIAVGTCASFGGLPAASPNPTGAVPLSAVLDQVAPGKPLIHIPGCPPIPEAVSAVLAHYLTYGRLPDLDALHRPRSFYGQTIHDRCARRPFYEKGLFAKSFDDEGAKRGWCLYQLGCKGPVAYNGCAIAQWNERTSWPIGSGHPCLGCASPNFWDRASFYAPLPRGNWGESRDLAVAAGAGAAMGLTALAAGRHVQASSHRQREAAIETEKKE